MSVVIDAKYRQHWTVTDLPGGGGSATFKVGTTLIFKGDKVEYIIAKTAVGKPGVYTSSTEDLTSNRVSAPFGSLNMSFLLNNDGSGSAQDITDPKTLQALRAATPPIAKPTHGGGGSDITGLVVFLAVIAGFVAFLNEKKL